MKIEIDIDLDQFDELVRRNLIDSYYASDEDKPEIRNALIKVIDYYSNREQFEEFLNSFAHQCLGAELASGPYTFKTEDRYNI